MKDGITELKTSYRLGAVAELKTNVVDKARHHGLSAIEVPSLRKVDTD
jgi:hypothetical protein